MAYDKHPWTCHEPITVEKLNHMEDGIEFASSDLTNIAYSELKALRDGGQLVKGRQYRITDYVCTSTDEETQVESHPFDIIVVADSESVLNENARAALKADDTYYVSDSANAVLESWELKYCIDNDTVRFGWVDPTNGKGVIYYMKDDRGNECAYDFKQIKFKRYEITECAKNLSLVGKYIASEAIEEDITVDSSNPLYFFTFSCGNPEYAILDASIKSSVPSRCRENKINPRIRRSRGTRRLNNIVFVQEACYSNVFEDNCYSITFGEDTSFNVFGGECHCNTFGNNCYDNTFGEGFNYNTVGTDCYSNAFGNDCGHNNLKVGCYSNVLGNDCRYNTLGKACWLNTFENACSNNTLENNSASDNAPLQHYHILSGTGGNSETNPLVIANTLTNEHVTYVGNNSSGVLKYFCPMDLAQ